MKSNEIQKKVKWDRYQNIKVFTGTKKRQGKYLPDAPEGEMYVKSDAAKNNLSFLAQAN